MKKFFLIAIVFCGFTLASQAQIPDKQVKAITGADTITISNVGSKVVSLDGAYVEGTGTSAGKFYFQGTVDGIFWSHIDSSKSLADVATAQGVHVAVTATTYKDYRLICSNTSAATATLYFTVFRRPDDR